MTKYFYIILFFVTASYSQDFSLISKAEKIIDSEKPDFVKAEKLLARAKNDDYGFCANVKLSALSEIGYLTARIYYLKSDYKKSLAVLDSGKTWEKQKESDLLKVMCLSKIYGKTEIRNLILNRKDEIIRRDSDFRYKKICLKLESINYNFCFYDQNEELNYKTEVGILEIIRASNFYTILE